MLTEFVVIREFNSRSDAEIAQGLLKDAHIESAISADDAGGFLPSFSLTLGQVRLLVWPKDIEKANEVLSVLETEATADEVAALDQASLTESKEKKVDFLLGSWIKIVFGLLAIPFIFLLINQFLPAKSYYADHHLRNK